MRQAIAPVYLYLSFLLTAAAVDFGLAQQHHLESHIQSTILQNTGAQTLLHSGMAQLLEDHDNDGVRSGLVISDVLPRTRSINIFASLTRDVSSVENRLNSTSQNSTLLAPLNSAMASLPRKPWEDRPGDTSEIKAADNQGKAEQNIEHFVEEHIVPVSPWKPGKENKVKTLGGKELWWEERGGKKVVLPDELVVDGVVGRVGNGEIWSLKGVVNYV